MEEFRTLIVYKTSHGTTRKYANWLADALNADVIEATRGSFINWSSIMNKYDMVMYGGNVNETGINGIRDFKAALAKNPAKRVTIFAVGSFRYSEETEMEHFNAHFSEEEQVGKRLFYFRGRLDYIGLRFLEKRLMKGLMKAIEKKYPEDRTESESEILEAYYDDVDWSNKGYIQPAVDYVKSFMTEEQLAYLEPIANERIALREQKDAEAEAAFNAEMDRREALHEALEQEKEEYKLKRMTKRQREAYLARKAAEEMDTENFFEEGEEYEPADNYDELEAPELETPEDEK